MCERLPGILRSIALLMCFWSATAHAADWEWSVTPFLWGSDISLDASGESVGDVEAELDFDDLVDKLDFAALVHFEGRRGPAGFFAELTYLATSDDYTTPSGPALPGGTEIESDVETLLAEAGGFLRPFGAEEPFELILGLRLIELDVELDLTLPGPLGQTGRASSDQSLLDVFAGARYRVALNERWSLTLRGDVGTGDTQFTWNAVGLVSYQFGRDGRYGVVAGYRHMDIELEDPSEVGDVEVHQVMSGPIAGFMFRF